MFTDMLEELKELIEYSQIDYIVSDFENVILNLEDEGIEVRKNIVNYGIWKIIELSGKYKYNESNPDNRILINYFEDRQDDDEFYVNEFLDKIKLTNSWRLIIQSELLKPEKNNWTDFKDILFESVENLKGMGYRSFIMYKEKANDINFDRFESYESSFEDISEWRNSITLVAIEEVSRIEENNIITKFESFENHISLEDEDLETIKDLFIDVEDEFNLSEKETFDMLESGEFRIKWYYEETFRDDLGETKIDEKNKSLGISIFGFIDLKKSKIDIELFKEKWVQFLKRVQSAGYKLNQRNLNDSYMYLRKNAFDSHFSEFYFSSIINI